MENCALDIENIWTIDTYIYTTTTTTTTNNNNNNTYSIGIIR
jgi:hypothetical protein